MRWGTPVIGTRAGGIPEIVEDGESGLLVSPGNRAELADAIVALLEDEGRRRRIGEAGRRRVEAEFSAGRMAERAVAFYEQAIGGH
jgi:glycosyltransferase involved in cell wall biosynthesis